MPTSKKWWESKTVWYNIVMTAVLSAAFLQEGVPVPTWVKSVLVAVEGVGNIVLRVWFTNRAVTKP